MSTEPGEPPEPSPRGRQAEARRNDERIVGAAVEVLAADPTAPMSAVARAAGVGQASLYRRYPDRESLLVAVCESGLAQIGDRVTAALAVADPWEGVAGFLGWYVESEALRISALLGTFEPPERLFALAHGANTAMASLVRRAVEAGVVRAGVTGADLTLLATQIGALVLPHPDRTRALRRRYLALALQGLQRLDAEPLPGPPPDADELEAPWRATTTDQRSR